MTTLQNKVVLITGATGTAGSAAARELLSAGAQVMLHGRDEQRLNDLASTLPRPCQTFVGPLSSPEAAMAIVTKVVADHGQLDGVVHLVGGWKSGGLRAFNPKDLLWLHEQLVLTTASIASAAAEPLRHSHGRFINVSSSSVTRVTAANAAYTASKAAADTWVTALSTHFSDSGAAVITFELMALLTDEMKAANPNKTYSGWTHVNDLARGIVEQWQLARNGTRVPAPNPQGNRDRMQA